MTRPRRYILILFAAAAALLTACTTDVAVRTVVVTSPPKTVVVTATAEPTQPPSVIPTPPPAPKTLTVCLAGEPDTLYLYGDSRLEAARHVMAALYDGPIDYVDYAYKPILLQRLPSLADGDAITRTVRVQEGSPVVTASGEVMTLTKGVRVRPAGCYADDCAVTFTGKQAEPPLQMDRMEVTFLLREDVAWADGEPLTADDSVFAFEVASDPATPAGRDLVARTESYRAFGDWRVKWTGLPGYAPHDYFLNFFPPLPRHQLQGRSPASLLQARETRRRPLGWGPFVVEEWITGEHITLSRNPHYFRAAEGLPLLDRVTFRFVSDAAEMMTQVLSGKCDVGVHDAGFDPLLPILVQAEQEGLLEVVAAPGTSWEQLDFGIAPASTYRRANFFGDVRVRQAIAQCIEGQAIVEEVTHGYGMVLHSYLPPYHPLYAGDAITLWDYDPGSGQALLEQVGWIDNDEDGVREARRVQGIRDGTRFEVTLLVPAGSPAREQAARIIKTNLADCGIRVTLEVLPTWTFYANGPDGPFFGRQFDLAETTWQLGFVPPCSLYTSAQIPDKGRWAGSNASGYSNADYDAACQAALQALPGSADYRTRHAEPQIIFSEELPAVPLFAWPRIAVARPGVLNFALDATSPSELWNVEWFDVP